MENAALVKKTVDLLSSSYNNKKPLKNIKKLEKVKETLQSELSKSEEAKKVLEYLSTTSQDASSLKDISRKVISRTHKSL